MKKFLALISVILLTVLIISSCAPDNTEKTNSGESNTSSESFNSSDNSNDTSSEQSENNSSDESIDTSSEQSDNNSPGDETSDVSETSGESPQTNNTFNIKVKDDMPEYKFVANFDNISIKNIVITDTNTQEVVQTITLEGVDEFENYVTAEDALQFFDITFDGAVDFFILSYTGRYNEVIAFTWDSDKNEFTYLPQFQQLGYVVIDSENERLLAKNYIWLEPSRTTISYSMWTFDGEKYVCENRLSLIPSEDLESITFKETKGEGDSEEVIAEVKLDYDLTKGFNKTNEKIKDYFEAGSFWDLDNTKWEKHFEDIAG